MLVGFLPMQMHSHLVLGDRLHEGAPEGDPGDLELEVVDREFLAFEPLPSLVGAQECLLLSPRVNAALDRGIGQHDPPQCRKAAEGNVAVELSGRLLPPT